MNKASRLFGLFLIIFIFAAGGNLNAADPADAVVYLTIGYGQQDKTEITDWNWLTGFVINNQDKKAVLTAAHFIDDDQVGMIKEIWAIFRTNKRPARLALVGYDYRVDVAWLRFVQTDAEKDQSSLVLGDSQNLTAGNQVVSIIGHPLNLLWTVVSGKIANLNAGINNNFSQPQVIIYDGFIESGVSGSPLLNEKNEVVGMAVGSFFHQSPFDFGGAPANSLAVAIPVDDIKDVLPELKKGGAVEHPPLGMKFEAEHRLLDWEFQKNNISRPTVSGLMITVVKKNSAEEQAGLLAGDVILSCDNREPKDACDLYRLIYFRHDFDEEMELKINRYGQDLTIKLKFSRPP